MKALQIGKNLILKIFIKNGFLAHSAKIFPNSRHQKILLARLHHFQQNRSTIERFINNLNFFSTPEEKNRDEPGAELVRDELMVSLEKMMLINRPFRIYVVRSNLNTSKLPRLSLTDIIS
jgi:hypothetical protein